MVAQTGHRETCANNEICKIRAKYTNKLENRTCPGHKNKLCWRQIMSSPSFPLKEAKECKIAMTSREN